METVVTTYQVPACKQLDNIASLLRLKAALTAKVRTASDDL